MRHVRRITVAKALDWGTDTTDILTLVFNFVLSALGIVAGVEGQQRDRRIGTWDLRGSTHRQREGWVRAAHGIVWPRRSMNSNREGNRTMTRIIGVGLAVFGVLATGAWGDIVDAVAATVGTEVILQSDVMEEIGPLLTTLQSSASSQAEFDREVRKAVREALDQAVDRKILYREAVLAGVEVPEEEVESRLDKIRGQYESQEAFMKMVEEAGETLSDFRERMRKQIMAISVGMYRRREFEKEAVVSEAEVAQYYQDHPDEFSRPERVKARRIFLAAPADAAQRAKVRARLDALREEIELGADMAELAKQHSDGPNAEDGGALDWVRRGDLVEPLEEALFALEEGAVSAPIETEYGFSLFKAEQKEEAGNASFDEVRNEIEPILRARYADERYEKWIAELRKRSQVRIYM